MKIEKNENTDRYLDKANWIPVEQHPDSSKIDFRRAYDPKLDWFADYLYGTPEENTEK